MPVFDYEWIEAPPYPDPSAHRTMAKLTIRVGDHVATRVHDRYLNDYHDHVFVPLAQVAEWVVQNWWSLLHEPGNVPERQRAGFDARHDISHAGFGFALPQLTFRPIGDRIRVVATRWNPRSTALEFLDQCDELVQREEFEDGLSILVEAVIERLRETGASFPELENDWREIRSADADEREFCRAAAIAGLDPFDVSNGAADSLVRFWNEVPVSLREDALAGSRPDSLDALRDWLAHQTAALNEAESGEDWPMIRSRIGRQDNQDPPWQRGYANARAVRRELSVGAGRFVLKRAGSLTIHSREVATPSLGILGCVASDSPSCTITPRRYAAKRFLIARALGDYIGRQAPGSAVLGTMETPRQAHSRAFAAELLAPAETLRSCVGTSRTIDSDAMDELAEELCVSPLVIQHQIQNHNIAEIPHTLTPPR